MRRILFLIGIATIGLLLGFGVVATSVESESAEPHRHGPDTHTHGDDGEFIPGDDVGPPPTPPEFPDDVSPSWEPLFDSNGDAIESEDGPLTIDVAGLAAARTKWLVDGGDLATDPPPEVADDEWFRAPSNHPLDPRWYAGFAAVIGSDAD